MLVFSPVAEHAYTVILLHGFSSNAVEMHEKMHGFFPDWFARIARFVYLTAPLRRIRVLLERLVSFVARLLYALWRHRGGGRGGHRRGPLATDSRLFTRRGA